MHLFAKTLIMKNPQTKKYGSNSDERESYFPNYDGECPKIVGEPMSRSDFNNKQSSRS